VDLHVGNLDLRRNNKHMILKKFRTVFFQGSAPSNQSFIILSDFMYRLSEESSSCPGWVGKDNNLLIWKAK